MFAAIGSVIGFLSSFFPRVFDYFDRRQSHKQELELMKESAYLQEKAGRQRFEEVKVEAGWRLDQAELKADSEKMQAAAVHDQATGDKSLPVWVNVIRALVRPFLTIGSVSAYIGILAWAIETKSPMIDVSAAYAGLEVMVSGVWSFWFGTRLQERIKR